MERIKRMQEQRAGLWEQMKALLDSAETESRDLSAEESEQYNAMDADLVALDNRIKQIQDAVEREQIIAAFADHIDPGPAPDDEGLTDEQTRFAAFAAGESRVLELGWPSALERRAFLLTDTQGGENLIPTTFVGRLYQHLVQASVIRQLGVQTITTTGGEPIQLPKTTAHTAKATIVGESTEIPEKLPTFGQVTLGAYKYTFLRQVSSEMFADNGVDLEGYLALDGGRALALGTDEHFWTGDGDDKPQGIVPAATVGVNGEAAEPSADEVISLFYSVIGPYRANAAWVANDATLAHLRKLKVTDGLEAQGQYLWAPGFGSAPNTILGRPVFSDPNIPAMNAGARSLLFGDFSAYTIREAGGIRIERSDQFAFDTDLVTIRYITRVDGELVDLTGAVKAFVGSGS